jgi:hypothetical protein
MQGPVVAMLMILAGIGVSNKETDEPQRPPALNGSASPEEALAPAPAPLPSPVAPAAVPVEPQAGGAIPPVYAAYGGPPVNPGYEPGHSIGEVIHKTVYSFFCGHDPDVMTAKEIEAAFYSGTYPGIYESPPSAVLSQDAPREGGAPERAGPVSTGTAGGAP